MCSGGLAEIWWECQSFRKEKVAAVSSIGDESCSWSSQLRGMPMPARLLRVGEPPQPAGENRHWGFKLFSGTNCVWRFMGEKQEEPKGKRQSKEKVWLSPLPFLQFGVFFLNYWSFWVGVCSWCGQHPRCQRICQPAATGLSRLSLLIIFSELMVLIL